MKINLQKVAELGGKIGEWARDCLFGFEMAESIEEQNLTIKHFLYSIRNSTTEEIKQLIINCIDITEEDEAQAAQYLNELKKEQMESNQIKSNQKESGQLEDNSDPVPYIIRNGRKFYNPRKILGQYVTYGAYKLLQSLAPYMVDNPSQFVKISQVQLADINNVSRSTVQLQIRELTNTFLTDGRPILEANVKNGVGSEFRIHPEVLGYISSNDYISTDYIEE